MKSVTKINTGTYKISTANDNTGKSFESQHKMWFYFSISGVTKDSQITLIIENINTCAKLYRDGHKPVVKSDSESWRYIPNNVEIGQAETYYIKFTFKFNDESKH